MKRLLYTPICVVLICLLYSPSSAQSNTNAKESQTNANADEAQNDEVFSPKQVLQKAVVKSRPSPSYPDWLREWGQATVVLRAILRSSGEITDIKVREIRPDILPSELAKDLVDRCTKAARKIKFKPATKDGHEVSQYILIEYNFFR